MCEGLFSSQGFPGLSHKLSPPPLGSSSWGLALVFPHVPLKRVPICCPPEAPTLSCIYLCHSLSSPFRQKVLCLGRQEGCVLLPLWIPLWGWVHLSLTGLMTMACSPVPQSPPPWLPEQQSIHGLPCSHLPYSLGLHTGPAGPASMQLANHICTCSPSPQLLSVLQVFARPGLAVEGLSPGSAWQTCICSQVASSEILPAASLTELGPPSSMLWKHFWQGECGKVGRIQTGRPALPHTMWPLVNK